MDKFEVDIYDTVLMTGLKKVKDQYLAVEAPVARTGIQIYDGAQFGRTGQLRIYRPEEEVFSAESMKSYANIPVTLEHPKGDVTAKNYRDNAVGYVGTDVIRDGNKVRVPFMVMDAKAVAHIEGGTKREVSMGYSCVVELVDGVTDEGEEYDGIQSHMRMNHLAVVREARGGKELKIGDSIEKVKKMTHRTFVVDGLPISDVSDSAQQALTQVISQRDSARSEVTLLTDSHAEALSLRDSEIGEQKAQIALLERQLADAADVDMASEVQAYVKLIDSAKLIAPDLVTDGMKPYDIKLACVKVGLADSFDPAAPKAEIEASFRGFQKFADAANKVDPVRRLLQDGIPASGSMPNNETMMHDGKEVKVSDSRNAFEQSMADMRNAHKS